MYRKGYSTEYLLNTSPQSSTRPHRTRVCTTPICTRGAHKEAETSVCLFSPNSEKMLDFYIGRQFNGFLYRRTHLMVNGAPVYKCARGSDWNDNNRLYCLFKQQGGRMIAVEGSSTAADPVNEAESVPQFRTIAPVQRIETNNLELRWEQWNTEANPARWD